MIASDKALLTLGQVLGVIPGVLLLMQLLLSARLKVFDRVF
jgi:hypothetical protein